MSGSRIQSVCLGVAAAVCGAIFLHESTAEPIRVQKHIQLLDTSQEVSGFRRPTYKTGGFHNWSATQATGAPNTKSAGDHVTAWASKTQDEQKEWLELTYEKPIAASTIMIYETFNPGAISKVEFWKSDEKKSGFWIGDVGVIDQPKRILMVPVPASFGEFDRVKLHIDSPAVRGWNEIDAVGLLGTDGKTHWAKSATASSSYSDLYSGIIYKPAIATDSSSEVQRLKNEIEQLKKRVERLEKALIRRPTPATRKPATETADPTPAKKAPAIRLTDPPAVDFFNGSVIDPAAAREDGDSDPFDGPGDPPEVSESTE